MDDPLTGTDKPFVAIVVLNWNNRPDTITCLTSLHQVQNTNHTIVVVDNGSTDDSVPQIRSRFPDVEILETGTNLGYAGGNNVGIHYALAQGADHVCLLNNDVIVAPDFLDPLLAAFQEQSDVGKVTPLVAEMGDSDRVWALGTAVNWRTGAVHRLHAGERLSALQARAPFEVDAASGAAMLVKRAVLEQVGLLDESFFLYFEETDWCLRARKAGYRTLAVPASVVWHKVSATLGHTSPAIDYYMLRNHLRFIARHWSGATRLCLLGRTVLHNVLTIAAYTLKPHSGRRLPHRNARLLALRDAILGRWGKMASDVATVCSPSQR